MKVNYHTHTKRCHHAFGSDEEYILAAIKGGYKVLGFSDHSPWKYDSDFTGRIRMPLSDFEDYYTSLTRLKEKGVLIFLDDFGKGYTSFGDLSDFDINIVKIDKSITQNATNQAGFLILKNIIRTAHDLGFKTLCEGIETEENKKIVVDAGCDMLQGYYFYRPMPVTQLETLFEEQ